MFQDGHSQRTRREKDEYHGFETPYQMPCGISGEERHGALPHVKTRRQYMYKELVFVHGEEIHDSVGEFSHTRVRIRCLSFTWSARSHAHFQIQCR